MYKIDTSHYPVVIVHTIEPAMKADMEAIIEAGQKLLAQNEPFALVMVSDGGESKERERGANSMITKWIKDNKVEFNRLCAGMASVVPTSALLAIYKPVMKTVGARMYKFPLDIFTDIEQARQWAAARLAEAQLKA